MLVIRVGLGWVSWVACDSGKGKLHFDNDSIWVECWCFDYLERLTSVLP